MITETILLVFISVMSMLGATATLVDTDSK